MMSRPIIHPGEILADELDEMGVSASHLARALHVPASRVTQILNGRRAITADTALRLGQYFGTGPRIWLNLQTNYEILLAEQESGEQIRSTVSPWKKSA